MKNNIIEQIKGSPVKHMSVRNIGEGGGLKRFGSLKSERASTKAIVEDTESDTDRETISGRRTSLQRRNLHKSAKDPRKPTQLSISPRS